ncbi:carboxypeptidase M32 [Denitrobaculum tricleocarpae]|uniref:Metal-dependent carboxypeptidase n=1 Tax=Denitrobaculum tricleocarpae TaxID=2591009 RepID=A0A545U1X7_9PROT|nr:carboxypeptidase M32 [Denitrobaculum tricleocarpae]TQV83468.1 carboxypeptidase M32 [Denitrobaculum tricleocarpae]
MTAYDTLQNRFRRLHALNEAAGVLHWDMSTMMPSGGAQARTEQLAVLSVTSHELLVDPQMRDLFEAAEQESGLQQDTWRQANLREMRRRWRHATALDADLVEATMKACKSCEMIWREARPKGDFAAVLPALGEVLKLSREAATAKAEVFDCSMYDALLDQYEPGGSSETIDDIFDDLAEFLPHLLSDVLDWQSQKPEPLALEGPFPLDAQEALAREMMQAVGFNFEHGRLDVSLHPFCGGVPDDVRITTRYDSDDFMKALMGVLHETGHALYERGLPQDWRLQPVGEARGMAVHESQSLLIEMQACRSAEFMAFAAPLARQAFGTEGAAWTPENLLAVYNQVKPDFIRVDADEVTYPAHVILRYRLEKALIEDEMPLAELPEAWNEGLGELLGITPPDDSLGCLQDIHWFDGAWGYFPTYTLGAMAAAQLFAAAKAAEPDIPADIAKGDFSRLMAWLGTNVHAKGSLLTTDELLEQATGKSLDVEIFKGYLANRYLN